MKTSLKATALLLLITGLTSCNQAKEKANASSNSEKPSVVYGYDNRINYSETTNSELIRYADSTAAKIDKDHLQNESGGIYRIEVITLGEKKELCSGESFYSEPYLAECSGFLVAPDILVTAGHCMDNQADCDDNAWAFGYTDETLTPDGKVHLPKKEVYSCSKVLDRVYIKSTKQDYAVIQLDRKVEGRRPLEFRKSGKISDNAPLTLVGYPSGIPLKIATGGYVVANGETTHFEGSIDAFAGNSGSPVFNSSTGQVEGILVRGNNDYVETEAGCNIVNVCGDTCDGDGEDITRITEVNYLFGRQPDVFQPGNSCKYAYDGVCDDGRPGSSTSVCDYGTDEQDCSSSSSNTGSSSAGANSCQYANDGSCDDGRPGSRYSVCEYGTDENDCSPSSMANSCEYANDGSCDDGRPGSRYSICHPGTDENDCSPSAMANSCEYANDGSCDDGRPGSRYSVCVRGTDENDCRGI